jgi:hypothetical protein
VCNEDSVIVLLHTEGKMLQEIYRTSAELTKELWFSKTGRFLTSFSKRENKNYLAVVDLSSKCLVTSTLTRFMRKVSMELSRRNSSLSSSSSTTIS